MLERSGGGFCFNEGFGAVSADFAGTVLRVSEERARQAQAAPQGLEADPETKAALAKAALMKHLKRCKTAPAAALKARFGAQGLEELLDAEGYEAVVAAEEA